MLLAKIWLGFNLAMPIGPVSIEMIKNGLNFGFLSAFSIRLGAVVGNALCLLVAYFGLTSIQQYPWLTKALSGLGIVLLFRLAITTLRQVQSAGQANIVATAEHAGTVIAPTLWRNLALGFVMSIANPIGVMFWLSIFAADLPKAGELLINFALLIGVLLWGAILSAAASWSRTWLNPTRLRYINLASGGFLLYYAVKYGFGFLVDIFRLFE